MSLITRTGVGLVCCMALLLLVSGARADRGDCMQPVSEGPHPKTTDCLYMLQASVGVRECADPCVCDIDGNYAVTATEALECLGAVFGQAFARQAPCPRCDAATATAVVIASMPGPLSIPDPYNDCPYSCPTSYAFSYLLTSDHRGWVGLDATFIDPVVKQITWTRDESGYHISDALIRAEANPDWRTDFLWADMVLDVFDSDDDGIADAGTGSAILKSVYEVSLSEYESEWDATFDLGSWQEPEALRLQALGGSSVGVYPVGAWVEIVSSRPLSLASMSAGSPVLMVNGARVPAHVSISSKLGEDYAYRIALLSLDVLPFGATVEVDPGGLTDAAGTPVTVWGSISTLEDRGPITDNPGFEGEGSWIGGRIITIGGFYSDVVAQEGDYFGVVSYGRSIVGYLDVPRDAERLRFWTTTSKEVSACARVEPSIRLRGANYSASIDVASLDGEESEWVEASFDLRPFRGGLAVFEARGGLFGACYPDVEIDLYLDNFVLE